MQVGERRIKKISVRQGRRTPRGTNTSQRLARPVNFPLPAPPSPAAPRADRRQRPDHATCSGIGPRAQGRRWPGCPLPRRTSSRAAGTGVFLRIPSGARPTALPVAQHRPSRFSAPSPGPSPPRFRTHPSAPARSPPPRCLGLRPPRPRSHHPVHHRPAAFEGREVGQKMLHDRLVLIAPPARRVRRDPAVRRRPERVAHR